MCIAIYKPAGVVIAKEILAQCFRANSDGAGFMYNRERKLHVHKGFFNFNDFWEAYEPYQEEQCVIHFRIKTHGVIDIDNCHPFNITSNIAFVHNGIIPGYGLKDKSDTYHFNERVLKRLVIVYGRRAIADEIVQELIEEAIGYSKLVFLDNIGNFHIYNESKGVWDGGVWYSNTSYKIPSYQVHRPYQREEPKVTVIHPTNGTAIIPAGKLVIKKANGFDIEEGEWVTVQYSTSGLSAGEYVCVNKIYRDNYADVEDSTGNKYYNIHGSYLVHPDYTVLDTPDYSLYERD